MAVRSETIPACTLETRATELSVGDRRSLLFRLGASPHVDQVPVLSSFLGDRRYLVRHAAAWSLAQIRSPESRRALEDALEELSGWRRRQARAALNVRLRRADEG
ncbi:MAG TPA: HEAT repeat domain-containing protein [Solirubrobacteraceae bacterium]